jgi:hypothetical protein
MTQLRHEVRVPIYWLMVGIAVVFLSPIASIWASVRIAQNNTRRIIAEQQRTQLAAKEEARRVACSFFSASLDAYLETPPTTATGRNLRETYLEFYRLSGCQPPRDK